MSDPHSGLTRTPADYLRHREPFELGGFRITPFLNDHSAFDAYSLLVEADGCRLFYTGDIRGHGRKAGIFEELLRTPPKDIDVMLTEGTNVRPEADVEDEETTSPESDVERACAQVFRDTQGMELAMYSAQNIDRLVTLFRAAKRSGRTFIMTLYGDSRGHGQLQHPRCGMATGTGVCPRLAAGEGQEVRCLRARRPY